MVSGVAYILFSRSELEPWNNPDMPKAELESEMKTLKKEMEEEPEDPTVLITEKIEQ